VNEDTETMKKSQLQKIIKEEIRAALKEGPPNVRPGSISPDIDWDRVDEMSKHHIDEIAGQVVYMINDRGFDFRREVEKDTGKDIRYPMQYLLEQLIKRLEEMV